MELHKDHLLLGTCYLRNRKSNKLNKKDPDFKHIFINNRRNLNNKVIKK